MNWRPICHTQYTHFTLIGCKLKTRNTQLSILVTLPSIFRLCLSCGFLNNERRDFDSELLPGSMLRAKIVLCYATTLEFKNWWSLFTIFSISLCSSLVPTRLVLQFDSIQFNSAQAQPSISVQMILTYGKSEETKNKQNPYISLFAAKMTSQC